jgi:excinuclease ABC subunit C
VLARALTFSANCEDNFFEEIPAASAVFLLRGDGEPYVSKTANLRRRLQRLLGKPAEQSKRLNLRERVREIEFTLTGSDFESQFLLYRLLREAFPKTYAARLRLRPAPLVKLHLENEYPRASVTTRLGRIVQKDLAESGVPARPDGRGRPSPHVPFNLYYGPFPSRAAAEKFASDALDFFKMRRCVDDLHPDPSFPGCVYSEMKMCLAPCYKGCTDEEYKDEVFRVQAFFDSGGESLNRELGEQRERASAQLAFEEAATIHTKLEKLKHLLSQLPDIVQRINRLAAIIVQPSAEAGEVELFHFANATLRGPVSFSIEQSGEPQSMESRLRTLIGTFPSPDACSATEHMEHLAILKRWYYRSRRIGEIFFRDEKGTWPLRRIVRGIARVYRGEKEQELASFSVTDAQSPAS